MAVIRSMQPDDWQTYRTVRLAALLDTPDAFGARYVDEAARTSAEWEAIVRERCASGMSEAWFAETDGNVVGLVGAFRSDPTQRRADLVSMWVDPAARGLGIARMLVDAVLGWALAADLTDVSLWVTRGNDAAQALYESMGFVVTGDHKALPSDPCKDEIRLVRRVQPV